MEFGGAGKPHWNWMGKNELDKLEEYILVDDKTYLKRIKIPKKLFKKVKLVDFKNLKKINFYKNRVDRIIASHVLEHIPDPENTIIKWINLLNKNGSLCMALPCDPGLMFRAGQLLAMSKACKYYKINPLEKDLWHSREHINPLQRLLFIFNYYFKKRKVFWFPFVIPFININLFHFVEVNKNDIR